MNYSIVSDNDEMKFCHEITISHPVRIVYKDGEPLFCGKDLAILLGYKEASDAVLNNCRDIRRIVVPNKNTSKGPAFRMLFLPESEVRAFVKKACSSHYKRICDSDFLKNFVAQLKLGRMPSGFSFASAEKASGSAVSAPTREVREATGADAESSMREALRIISLCKKFVDDVRAGA